MADNYNDLIFKLGDLAREHLADAANPPEAMEAVFAAEEEVMAKREEVAAVEEQMNQLDFEYQDFLDQKNAEMEEQKAIVRKWKSAVVGVENRSRELKKKLDATKAAWRTQRMSLKRADATHKELEMREGHDEKKIAISKENLKKFRLRLMRAQRDIEDMEYEFKQVLTPRPGQVGAQGILAHRRIMEVEDELEDRRVEHEDALATLDEEAALVEAEMKEVEAVLDDALFALGEAVYAERIPHRELNDLYRRLDNAK